MGSTSSRARPPSAREDRRSPRLGLALASFLCGGGASSSVDACPQMEDEAVEKSLMLARQHDFIQGNDLQVPLKESPFHPSSEDCSSSSMSGCRTNTGLKGKTIDLRGAESSNSMKFKELVPCLANGSSGLDMACSERNYEVASSSAKSEAFEPLLTNSDSVIASATEDVGPTSGFGLQSSTTRLSNSMSRLQRVDLPANGTLSAESPTNDLLGHLTSVESTTRTFSDPSASGQMLGEEPVREAIPSGIYPSTSDESGERRNESVLHLDVVNISSVLPNGSGEESANEARRYSRQMFWDAFSWRTSRRISDSATLYLSTEESDDLESRDRWPHGVSDDLFENEIEDDSLFLPHRHHHASRLRWHSRSEIRERLRSGLDNDSGRTTSCPSGLHPDGTCSCYSFTVSERSSTRASISRIVMLAEALFEVLDEIHRQPVPLSLSVVSLPAPESVVNSLPLKSHKKLKTGNGEDEEQCYICLSEYDDGDKIRVLPCRHEYHMSCIDKWLKEIHGVCPLCRGDVCEGASEVSIS